MPPGSSRPRVAHAHPLTADARASRIAVAFRDAERRERRLGRTNRSPRRYVLPAMALVAVVVVVALASQALTPAPLTATSLDDGTRMQAGADTLDALAAGASPAVTPAPPAPTGTVPAPTPVALTGYVWPVENARITQAFGPASAGLFVVDGRRFHDGIDIANFCGAPILAAHDGTVIAASRHVISLLGWTGDLAAYDAYLTSRNLWAAEARVIVIDDGDGYRSVYVHLHRIDVTVGQVVKAGQQIGLEGSSGHATGCHLHFSIYSPDDLDRWTTDPAEVAKYHLPTGEIARIDPLTVLPALAAGGISWGWGAQPRD